MNEEGADDATRNVHLNLSRALQHATTSRTLNVMTYTLKPRDTFLINNHSGSGGTIKYVYLILQILHSDAI